jgi:cell division protein FtsB
LSEAPSPAAGRAQLRRRALGTVFWFFATILVFNSLFGDMGLIQTIQTRRSAAALRRDVARLRSDNDRLMAEIQDLRHDPYRIETIAREELGLSRPGEIIFLFQDRSPAPPPANVTEPSPSGSPR